MFCRETQANYMVLIVLCVSFESRVCLYENGLDAFPSKVKPRCYRDPRMEEVEMLVVSFKRSIEILNDVSFKISMDLVSLI